MEIVRITEPHEPEPSAPIRSAGITPAPSVERGSDRPGDGRETQR